MWALDQRLPEAACVGRLFGRPVRWAVSAGRYRDTCRGVCLRQVPLSELFVRLAGAATAGPPAGPCRPRANGLSAFDALCRSAGRGSSRPGWGGIHPSGHWARGLPVRRSGTKPMIPSRSARLKQRLTDRMRGAIVIGRIKLLAPSKVGLVIRSIASAIDRLMP